MSKIRSYEVDPGDPHNDQMAAQTGWKRREVTTDD